MNKCSICGSELRSLFISFYCPNECDKKSTLRHIPLSKEALKSLRQSNYSEEQIKNWQGSINRCAGKVHKDTEMVNVRCKNDRKPFLVQERKTKVKWGTNWFCSSCLPKKNDFIDRHFEIIPMPTWSDQAKHDKGD